MTCPSNVVKLLGGASSISMGCLGLSETYSRQLVMLVVSSYIYLWVLVSDRFHILIEYRIIYSYWLWWRILIDYYCQCHWWSMVVLWGWFLNARCEMFASTFWPRFLAADMVGELSHVDPFQRAKMCQKCAKHMNLCKFCHQLRCSCEISIDLSDLI